MTSSRQSVSWCQWGRTLWHNTRCSLQKPSQVHRQCISLLTILVTMDGPRYWQVGSQSSDCPALRYEEVPAVKRVDIGQCDHVIMDTILEGRGDAQCDPVNHLTRENSRTRDMQAVAVKLTKELVTPPRHGLLRNNFIALSWCMKLYFLNFWFQYFVASLPGE